MGSINQATCRDCLHSFEVELDGGFKFELFRCTHCGKTREFPVPGVEPEPIPYLPEIDLDTGLEKQAEDTGYECKCGGTFTEDAPVRCPKCHSTNVNIGVIQVLYD